MSQQHDWKKIIPEVRTLIGECGTLQELANALNARLPERIGRTTLRDGLKRELGLSSASIEDLRTALLPRDQQLSALAQALLTQLRGSRDTVFSVLDLVERHDRSPSNIRAAAEELHGAGYNITITDDMHMLMPKEITPSTGKIPMSHWAEGNVHRYGIMADTHLGNRCERLDVMEAAYDLFEKEGIKLVLHAGNMVDGEFKWNRSELIAHGVEGQLCYAAAHYPKREGIQTQFLTGQCHEGWWGKNIGFDIGRHMENTFHDLGRTDLVWMGHVERDLSLHEDNERSVLRVMHPGGGSAYALCFDDTAEILTRDSGWVPFAELDEDAHVATMTKADHVFEWQRPTHITREPYRGDLLEIKHRCLEFRVTPNHRFWTRNQKAYKARQQPREYIMPQKAHHRVSDNELAWHARTVESMASGCKQRWAIPTACADWIGKYTPFIEVPHLEPLNRRNQAQMQHIGTQRIEDMAELVAWYVTEGYAGAKRVEISQSRRSNPANHHQIRKLLDRLGLRYGVSGRDEKSITISSKELAQWLREQCGHLSANKYLPSWLKNQPTHVLEIVLDTMLRGDGWDNHTAWAYKSISERLRDDFSEIAQKLGYGVTTNNKTATVHIRKIQTEPTINRPPRRIRYSGMVYCCSVPNELIYVRVNGRCFWSHNSYPVQKHVESFQGGEKPKVAIFGHYHKYEANYAREVFCLQPGTQCDQTVFMRQNKLGAHVGFCTLEIHLTEYGAISRVKHEWMPFYDRGFYSRVWDFRSMYEKNEE